MKYILEVIAFNIESCIAAQRAGANRIELCTGPGEGGTTPPYSFIKKARALLAIDLYVMIRPRGGDFLYSGDEFDMMKEDILQCKALQCDGVVLGILNKDGSVDTKRCRELVELAYPMQLTFHRAFDRVSNPFEALEDIISLGFERILTSGLVPQAVKGANTLKALVKQAGDRIIIMPGSGVQAGNLPSLAAETGAHEFHSSASTSLDSTMEYINSEMNEKLSQVTVNESAVEEMVKVLRQLEASS